MPVHHVDMDPVGARLIDRRTSSPSFAKSADRIDGAMRSGARHRPQMSLPIATAVSAMRFEKPHSLSYHESTRTNVPSETLVWSMWKVEEWGSWLKSIDTLGSPWCSRGCP